ncbi:MAG: HAD hydrolase-like protein [Acidobacteriota bacterium]
MCIEYHLPLQRRSEATRYRCLILDHDDTAVDSSRQVHYPAHVKAMGVLRPGQAPVDLDTWFCKNFEPGIMHFLVGELGMTPAEMEVEYEIWREFNSRGEPQFYPGFLAALAEYKAQGGAIAVVSHSEENVILSHYRGANGEPGVIPDVVFGWDLDSERRKPNPYPVNEILRRLGLDRRDALVVDDLKPGVVMAQAAGVDAAAAGWGHDIPSIRDFMKRSCVAYFATVPEFAEFILR